MNDTTKYFRLHLASFLTAICTFVLIFIGGMVTSKHAGMSVPDWPNSYGYNMFLFPPSKWVGGILFEHTHRLMGTVVGFCAVVMTLLAWAPGASTRGRRWIGWIFAAVTLLNALGTATMATWPGRFHLTPPASDFSHIVSQGLVTEVGVALCAVIAFFCRQGEARRWVRWIAAACLIAICVQGVLGGLRVDLINLTLAMVHGCFAQASFCLIVLAWIVTGRWWREAPNLSRLRSDVKTITSPQTPVLRYSEEPDRTLKNPVLRSTSEPASGVLKSPLSNGRGKWLIRLALLGVLVVYGQLIVGAVMRHLGAGLAIPDLPWAYGKLLPPTSHDQLPAINSMRVFTLDLDPVTLGQIWLHFAHRIGAIVVSAALLALILRIFLTHRDRSDLVGPAALLGALLLTQVTLGLLTVYWRKPADIASLHVATGALVLATTFFIAVRAMRLYSLSARSESVAGFPVKNGLMQLRGQGMVAEATAAALE